MREQRAGKIGPDHVDTLIGLANLAGAYRAVGRFEESIALMGPTLKSLEAIVGPDQIITVMFSLQAPLALRDVGRFTEAIEMQRLVIDRASKTFGADNPNTLRARSNLGVYLRDAGQIDEGLAIQGPAVDRLRALVPAAHPVLFTSELGLGLSLAAAGRAVEGLAMIEAAMALKAKAPSPQPFGALELEVLGLALTATGQYDRAAAARRDLLAFQSKDASPGDLAVASVQMDLAETLMRLGELDAAESYLRDALTTFERKSPEHWRRWAALGLLGAISFDRDRAPESLIPMSTGASGLFDRRSRTPVLRQNLFHELCGRLAILTESLGRPAEAASWKAKMPPPK